MTTQKWTRQFAMVVAAGHFLAGEMSADAMLVLLEGQTDWEKLRQAVPNLPKLIVAADSPNDLQGLKTLVSFLWSSIKSNPHCSNVYSTLCSKRWLTKSEK